MYSTTKGVSCQCPCTEAMPGDLWVTSLNIRELKMDIDEMIAVLEVQISRYDL